MSLIHQTLTSASLAARRRNAQKSTGPRTSEGKHRVILSLFQRVGPGRSLRRSMRALGESPRQFKRLLGDLVLSHQPGTPSEMMLVEDLAALRWQRWRCERARTGRLAWQRGELERAKLRREMEEYRTREVEPDALRARGLRNAPPSQDNYMQIVDLLAQLEDEFEKEDFATSVPGLVRALYGEQPTGRGAAIQKLVSDLNRPEVPHQFAGVTKVTLGLAVEEETHAALREYRYFQHQQDDITPLLGESGLAPADEDLEQLTKEVASIDRQIERKIRLLAEMQKAREAEPAFTPAESAAVETEAPGPESAEADGAPENSGQEQG